MCNQPPDVVQILENATELVFVMWSPIDRLESNHIPRFLIPGDCGAG